MFKDWMGKFARVPEKLWRRIEPLLPKYPHSKKGGRPRSNQRSVVDGIFYILRTGCQWKALPSQFGSPSTVHRYFQEWVGRRVFRRFWKVCLREYDRRKGIAWRWQSMDGAMTKAPLGGEKTGKNPTDRGKLGVKRSVLTDGRGIPLAVAIAGANAHDQTLFAETLAGIPIGRPRSNSRNRQHLCLDKGYQAERIRRLARRRGYTAHIPMRGKPEKPRRKGQRARRWVVERAHSWTNRCRRLLVRWEKKPENYLGFVHLQFAYVTLRAAGVLG